ncbi:MAG: chromosome segregation protein ScpA [Planctomycetes bacterium]|nr:chromosome segregation protein ScpA [Planctomycetota bacterium]
METGNNYKVDLDIYNGPVDLLLYLIKKEEVNIYDIPISRITEQYLQYVDALQKLDMNNIGDFLIMAATLMYIKSYMLLPKAEMNDEEEIEDPRTSLVKQLLEYKKYKETSISLSLKADHWSRKWKRLHYEIPLENADADNEEKIPLDGVSLWDLLQRFSDLMSQTLFDIQDKTIVYDDIPVKDYMEDVLMRVQQRTSVSFTSLFEGIRERHRIIGFFLALLELVRLHKVRIEQPINYSEIQISLFN